MRTKKMRGQAFIVFKERERAQNAMRSLNGKPFLGKSIRISFAKTKSFASYRNEGVEPLFAVSGASK
ncbi:MAG: hypothetical protein EZS28_053889 [Streblomastix strix]|uniref:RRM domain-containing protein n=1 Tax=Streblomastix strix TaxID=222440 RepID=A0A5J4R2G8_9EUKA|nr:MAG: hypothetical protein EZS28_053889 [Streblomastix strix]